MDLRFGGLFRRVWGGFWEAKILDFRTFFDVFSKSFLKRAREEQKIDPRGPKNAEGGFLVADSGCPQPPGERKRKGNKNLALHKELGLSDSPSVIDLGI